MHHRTTAQKKAAVHHPRWDGDGGLRLHRGLRHLRMALWTIGDFARCGGREFRPVRGATKGSAFGNRDFLKKIE